MVISHVPEKLWDYGYRKVDDIVFLTQSSSNILDTITLLQVTGYTPYILECLDFVFMIRFVIIKTKVWDLEIL